MHLISILERMPLMIIEFFMELIDPFALLNFII